MEHNNKIDIDTIVDHIKTDRDIVPIIGDNVFRVKTEDGEYIPVQQYVIRKLAQEDAVTSGKTDLSPFFVGYRGMNRFTRQGRNVRKSIFKLFRDDTYFKENLEIDKNVRDLIERGNFDLILTTCIFPWTEILDIKTGDKELEFRVYQCGADESQDIEIKDNQIIRPTIYHLFGMMGKQGYSSNTNCVITEDELIKYLHSLHSDRCPKRLITYFAADPEHKALGKRLFALGCSIPDWTFRFLLYSIKDYNYQWQYDTDFVGGYVDVSVDSIQELLDELGYQYDHNPQLLNSIVNQLPEPEQKPTMFISACDDDYDYVEEYIYNKLKDKFHLWFFKRDGDPYKYWDSIIKALNKSKYILPVISHKILDQKIRNYRGSLMNDEDPGITEEWTYAIENNIPCCPLYINYLPKYETKTLIIPNVDTLKSSLEGNPKARDAFYQFFFPNKIGAGGLHVDENFNSEVLFNHLKNHL